MSRQLHSWNDGAAKSAIIDFITRVTTANGPDFVPPADRIATFDNDGTLWCEKPMYIQLDFTLRRWVEMANETPALREQQPWKAAVERDYAWLGSAVTKHYRGDDSGDVLTQPHLAVLDDGPAKPPSIWSRIGKRPILAAGNSNGDIQMLQFANKPPRPALRLLVLHDDAAREFDYVAGAEKSLELARQYGWSIVSMKDDWRTVFV